MTSTDSFLVPVAALGRARVELIAAVRNDQRRSRRRRRSLIVVATACSMLAVVGVSIAATTGLFSPAPEEVKQTFRRLAPSALVDTSRAVRIGVIDDHPAYAAPKQGGGFCLYYAPNPRSGPNGSVCTASDPTADEVAVTVSVGTDGGFAFGRVGSTGAAAVEIEIPKGGGTLRGTVGESGFFLAELTERALAALTIEHEPGPKNPPTKDGGPIVSFDAEAIDAITATARTADGIVVATGRNDSMPDPGMPTTTAASPPG